MAWIKEGKGGRWAEREERQKMIDERKSLVRSIDDIAPTLEDKENQGLLHDYHDLLEELVRLERIHRCEVDTYEFALEYFGETRNPGNDGNWEGFDTECKEDAPEFHVEMTEIIDWVSNEEVNGKFALAAPRSHAKSTWFTKDFPIHQVVYRKRRYGIIISETPTVAVANMAWIRSQLKINEKLRQDFGELLSPKDQANEKDNSENFIAWYLDPSGRKRNLALLEAASTGQALRGRNWNGMRPDFIICDDLEDARPGGNASTPEQRAKLRDWFSQTVMALGDPKGARTAYIIVGTTVHYESLLMEVLHNRSDFKSKIYRAIITEPLNTDLWETCRMIYQNHENKNRADDAKSFYKANYDKMMDGAKVLWGAVQPLWKLMTWKWDNGSKAFNTEYMNNPIDEESMIFNPQEFTYWNEHGDKKFTHNDYYITMGIDLAMGKQRGDYSAIVVTAVNKETNTAYIIEAWGERVHPDVFIEEAAKMVVEYQPDLIAVEAVAAQEFFADKLSDYLQALGYPAKTRIKKIYSRSRKELRIEAMLPDIESGKIQFKSSHALLLEQFERYGQGSHDDLPDAMEMSLSVAKRVKRRIKAKPNGM